MNNFLHHFPLNLLNIVQREVYEHFSYLTGRILTMAQIYCNFNFLPSKCLNLGESLYSFIHTNIQSPLNKIMPKLA
jgi:hypothetical protein